MKSILVNIICKVVERREDAIAVINGTMEEVDDLRRLKWFWLPCTQIEFEEDDFANATVTMPEWLARAKGLL